MMSYAGICPNLPLSAEDVDADFTWRHHQQTYARHGNAWIPAIPQSLAAEGAPALAQDPGRRT